MANTRNIYDRECERIKAFVARAMQQIQTDRQTGEEIE